MDEHRLRGCVPSPHSRGRDREGGCLAIDKLVGALLTDTEEL